MKIRQGYVSNSSSSSFLVLYKGMESFENIMQFRGTKEFLEDIKDYNKDSISEFVLSVLGNYLYVICDKVECKLKGKEQLEYWSNLYKESYLQMDDFLKRLGNFEFAERMNKLQNYLLTSSSFEELQKRYEQSEREAKKMRDDIIEYLGSLSYTIRQITYEDDTSEGNYMQHYFMPFLSKYPNDDIKVITVNNH